MAEYRGEQRFAHDLIDRHEHADKIEFDFRDYSWDLLRLAFEQNGYSVHCQKESPSHVVAFRVKPDLAPVSERVCVASAR